MERAPRSIGRFSPVRVFQWLKVVRECRIAVLSSLKLELVCSQNDMAARRNGPAIVRRCRDNLSRFHGEINSFRWCKIARFVSRLAKPRGPGIRSDR